MTAAPPRAGDPSLSRDALLDGGVTLYQPARGYRVAIDPVFLAAAIAAKRGEHVCDAGAGVGAASLCLAYRLKGVRVTGIELQGELAAVAWRNIAANNLEDRVAVVPGDILHPPPSLIPGSFHHVMINPPHLEPARADAPPHNSKALSHMEGDAALGDWVDFALAMVRQGGSITIIHRAGREQELLAALRPRAGEITVFPLLAGAGKPDKPDKPAKPAKRLIIQAFKGARAALRQAPGLVLHRPGGGFTAAADSVLRQARGLKL